MSFSYFTLTTSERGVKRFYEGHEFDMRDFIKAIILTCVILGVFAGGSVFYVVWKTSKAAKEMKPYISYTKLVNLADGFNDYKKQKGVWPADITQLINIRPDLVNDITDAYNHAVIVIPYSEKAKYGEAISYGQDGKPGGDNRFDQDIVIRFPVDAETNVQWNKQVAERFKSRASRGLW